MKDKFKTRQEEFWAGKFGTDYIDRNQGEKLLASNLAFFSKVLQHAKGINSIIEFGANIGMNLKPIQLLCPGIIIKGIEINHEAAKCLKNIIGSDNVFQGSIYDYEVISSYDVVLCKTVLIHINPEMLPNVYEKLYKSCNKYILICEYYNPKPVTVNYRGNEDVLFKRDFAGEMLDKYQDLSLLDYGFTYNRDNSLFDDITWFLLEKNFLLI